VGWSTGNWGPTDFPPDSDSATPQTYPPFDKTGQGWQKLNRDYQVYVRGSPGVAGSFQGVFDGDLDEEGTGNFPSKVYAWTPQYQVKCGTG